MDQYNPTPNRTEIEKPVSAAKYFKEAALYNYIYSIDPRIKSRGIHLGFCEYSKDSDGQATLLLLRNDSDEHRVLIDYKPNDENPENEISIFKSMDLNTAQNLVEFYRSLSRRLDSRNKRELLRYLTNFNPSDFPNFTQAELLNYIFKYFPETDAEVKIEEISLPIESSEMTDKERKDLENAVLQFLKIVPKEKIDYFKDKINLKFSLIAGYEENNLNNKLEQYLNELVFLYKFEVLNEVSGFNNEFEPEKFSIENEIKNNIQTIEEVKEGLKKLGVPEEFPTGLVSEEFEYQVVDLSKVVGGFNMQINSESTWEISNSDGRGINNILGLCKTFQEQKEIKTDRPICFVLKDGKYYCFSDGRHRTVALKLLGVDKIPAKVYTIR